MKIAKSGKAKNPPGTFLLPYLQYISVLILHIICELSGVCKALSSNGHFPIDSEKEISDDELENLALTFLSPEILSGMVDSNWKTRLSKVQEFSQVCVKV